MVILNMNSKRANVDTLTLFLKPQSPAERLTAQQRDCEKLQRERQLKELQEEEAKARGEAGKRPVGHPRGSKNKPPPLAACKSLTSLSPASKQCAAAAAAASATASASASATASATASSTHSSNSAQAAFTGEGASRTQKSIPKRALPKCPQTQKLTPSPPHD